MESNRNLITNKIGNAQVIILAIFTAITGFAMLTIGTQIYFSIASSADAGTLTASPGSAARGVLTFSSNVTCGNFVNITNAAGTKATFRYNITGGGCWNESGKDYTNVTLTVGNNNSVAAAQNLTMELNRNATVNATMSAVNGTNTTTLTYLTVGTAGNSVVTTSTVGSWSSGTLLSGTAASTGQASQNTLNNYVTIVFPLFGLALMLVAFGVIFITLKKSFGGNVGR